MKTAEIDKKLSETNFNKEHCAELKKKLELIVFINQSY